MDSYKVVIHVFKANPNAWFYCAEETIKASPRGGAWSVDKEERILKGDSGVSGALRFVSDMGESFLAVCGVDQNMPWCDIVPNLAPEDTALAIHPQYYDQPDRIAIREEHLTSRTVTNSHGRNLAINFTVAEGQHFYVNLVIG